MLNTPMNPLRKEKKAKWVVLNDVRYYLIDSLSHESRYMRRWRGGVSTLLLLARPS